MSPEQYKTVMWSCAAVAKLVFEVLVKDYLKAGLDD